MLTPKQKQVVDFMRGFKATKGYMPTYQEIADHCCVTLNAIRWRMKPIMKAGVVSKNNGSVRAFVINDEMPGSVLIGDLVCHINRLTMALNRFQPQHPVAAQASAYLAANGLRPSALRGSDGN